MRLTKKQLREAKLLEELRTQHGYLVMRAARESERYTTIFKRRGKTMTLVPAVMLSLAVPADSGMGRQVIRMYERTDKTKKKKRA